MARTVSHSSLLKSSIFLTLSRIVSMASGFVVLGMLGRGYSINDYAVWAILLSVFQITGAIDIGIGAALRNKVSVLRVAGEDRQGQEYVISMAIVLSCLVTVFSAAALASGQIARIAGLPDTGNYEHVVAVPLVIAAMTLPLSVICQCFYSYIEAHYLAWIDSIRSIMQMAVVGYSYKYNIDFNSLVYMYYGINLLTSIPSAAFYFYCRKYNPYLYFCSGRVISMVIHHGRELIGKAGMFALLQAAALVMFNASAILVSHIGTMEEVAHYTTLQRLFSAATSLYTTFMASYWGAFSAKYAEKDYTWIEKTLNVSSAVTFGLWLAGVALTFAAGPAIVELWTSIRIENPPLYGLLLLWSLALMLSTTYSLALNGMGRFHIQALVLGVGAAASIPAAIIMGKYIGLSGVIISTLLVTATAALSNRIEVFRHLGQCRRQEMLTGKTDR